MARPLIIEEECSGCGTCVDACPSGALDVVRDVSRLVRKDACEECGTCIEECPMGAMAEGDDDERSDD